MILRRPVLSRMVGSIILIGLLALNVWLVLLNLAKHDRLPESVEALPGVGNIVDGAASRQVDAEDEGSAEGGQTAAFNADGTVPAGPIEVDDWPGGRGPVPDGQPVRRQVLVGSDGGLRVIGSAPEWSVVTQLVDSIGRRLDRDPSAIGIDVDWHPDASPRVGDGEVVLEQPLRYRAGQIELPEGGAEILAPVVALLAANPELYVVVVGQLDEADAGDEQAAVALGRTSVVADHLVASGLESDRVVTSVAPTGAGQGSDPTVDRVVLRIENMLTFGPNG